jgi:hypothetical protein
MCGAADDPRRRMCLAASARLSWPWGGPQAVSASVHPRAVQRAADAGGMLLRAKRWRAGGGRDRLLRLFYAWYDGWATLFYAPTFSEAFGFLITWSARLRRAGGRGRRTWRTAQHSCRSCSRLTAASKPRVSPRISPGHLAAWGLAGTQRAADAPCGKQAQCLFLCRLVVHLFFQVWEEENSKVMAAADAILVRHIGRRRHPSRKRRTTPDTTGQR